MKNKLTKLLILLSLSLVLIFANFTVSFAKVKQDYTTNNFDVKINALVDNTYEVTEKIGVNFAKPHHGIYRYIPETNSRIYDVDVEGENYDTEYEDGYVIVKIGSEDEEISGNKDYVINYKLKVITNKNQPTNFMNLNVFPTNWDTPVASATATINMPKVADYSKLQIFAGKAGAKSDTVGVKVNAPSGGTKIELSTQNLEADEGVTIYLPLQEGYWENEETSDWAFYPIMGAIILLPLLVFLIWLFVGKSPKVVKTVEFYPPEGMTPGEVGYVIDGVVDKQDLVSMIVYYADKGYLTIREYGNKKFEVTKVKDIDPSEKKFSRTLFNGLFRNGDVTRLDDLDEDFGQSFLNAKDFLENDRKIYSKSSSIGRIVSIILMGLTLIITSGFSFVYEEYTQYGFVVGVAPAAMAMGGIFILMDAFDRRMGLFGVKNTGKMILGGILTILAVGVSVTILLTHSIDNYLAVGLIVSTLISLFIIFNMISRTKESASDLGKILGLKEFIKLAEKPKLEKLIEENPNYFYNIIPYAYVLGLSDKWIKDFADIKIEEPNWYVNDFNHDFVFNVFLFSNILRGCHHSFSNNIHIPADVKIGGLGGGGFSGGGFGGGGGGAW